MNIEKKVYKILKYYLKIFYVFIENEFNSLQK